MRLCIQNLTLDYYIISLMSTKNIYFQHIINTAARKEFRAIIVIFM